MVRNLMLVVSAAVALSLSGRDARASEHWDTVNPNHTDSYSRVSFAPGHSWVEVVGDHYTDLDLYVYDEDNRMVLIDSDTGATDHCVVRFYVKEPGTCTIQIKNLGGAYNHYLLRTSD